MKFLVFPGTNIDIDYNYLSENIVKNRNQVDLRTDFIGKFIVTYKTSETKTEMLLEVENSHVQLKFQSREEPKSKDLSFYDNFFNNKNNDSFIFSLLKKYILLIFNKINFNCNSKNINIAENFTNNFFDLLYNQRPLITNDQKESHLLYLCKNFYEFNDFEKAKIKKLIRNVIRSIELSNYGTREQFKKFFAYFDDFELNNDDF